MISVSTIIMSLNFLEHSDGEGEDLGRVFCLGSSAVPWSQARAQIVSKFTYAL